VRGLLGPRDMLVHDPGPCSPGLAGAPGNYARVHDALKDNLAQLPGLPRVPIRVIDDIAAHGSSWSTVEEVVRNADAVGPNNLRLKGKRLPY
jgi:hypothetical protein